MPNDKQGFVTGLLPPPVSFVAARRQGALGRQALANRSG